MTHGLANNRRRSAPVSVSVDISLRRSDVLISFQSAPSSTTSPRILVSIVHRRNFSE